MSSQKSRFRRFSEIILAVGLMVLLLLWMAGVFHHKVGPDAAGLPATAVPAGAEIYTLTSENMPAVAEIPGSVEPYQAADLSAKVMGTVQVINVRAGDRVSAGQVLAIIESPELAAQVLQASGSVASSAARTAQAQRDLARMENLYSEGIISQSELERARTEFALSRASETGAAGAIGATRIMAEYRHVRAPFAGVIATRHLDPGAMVSPGTPILTIHDPRRWQFVADLRARDYAALALHDTVTIMLDETQETMTGTVAEVQPALDPASHSRRVKIDMPQRADLTAGLFGRIHYTSSTRQVRAIPASAVQRLGTLQLVRAVVAGATGDIVESRYIRCGAALPDGRLEVLSGLQPGDRILARP